jgi:hypothetical protein
MGLMGVLVYGLSGLTILMYYDGLFLPLLLEILSFAVGIVAFGLLCFRRKWKYVTLLTVYGILNLAVFWFFAFLMWMAAGP